MAKKSFFDRIFFVSAIIFGVWLVVGLLVIYVGLPLYVRGSVVTIRDFRQMPVRDATALAESTGLRVNKEYETRSDDLVPYGHIISQLPDPGQRVKENRPISFIVSTGPESVDVPELAEKTLADAEFELEIAGLSLGQKIYVYSDEHPEADGIITTAPSPKARVPRATLVDVLVSRGPRPVEFAMPQLVGLTFEEAQRTVRSYRMWIGDTVQRRVAEMSPGAVVGQSPNPGEIVLSGQRVTLTVNEQTRRDSDNIFPKIVRHRVSGNTAGMDRRIKIVVQDERGSHEVINGFEAEGKEISQPFRVTGRARAFIYEDDMDNPVRVEDL